MLETIETLADGASLTFVANEFPDGHGQVTASAVTSGWRTDLDRLTDALG